MINERETPELTAKWLRDIKNIYVSVSPNPIFQFATFTGGIREVEYKGWVYNCIILPKHKVQDTFTFNKEVYPTYEEALNAGIKEALELLDSTEVNNN